MQITNTQNDQTNLIATPSTSQSNENFTNHLQESVETLDDIRIKHGVEQEIIDTFMEKKSVGSFEIIQPKNIDKIYNPLANATKSETSITFIDEITNQEVTIALTGENAAKLKAHFGSLQDATKLVKQWYNDAAYGVGYLEFDSDQNGIISEEEALNLNSLVSLDGDDGYMSIAESIEGEKNQKAFLQQFGFINNINDFINLSITQDGNFDGYLSNAELLGDANVEVVDAMLSQADMDIFAFNELIASRIGELPTYNYARIAQNAESELLSTILQEI